MKPRLRMLGGWWLCFIPNVMGVGYGQSATGAHQAWASKRDGWVPSNGIFTP